jgi:cytochrome c553
MKPLRNFRGEKPMPTTKMYRTTKLGFLVFVGACLCAGSLRVSATPRQGLEDDPKNIISAHDSNSKEYKKNCEECHAAIHTEESLDPGIPTAHRAMAPFAAGRELSDQQCRWCHRTVDLQEGTQRVENSQGNIRRHVDVELCAFCHGPFGDGSSGRGYAPVYYQTSPFSLTNPDGPALYDLLCAACHRPLDRSQVSGDASKIQKAIDNDKGGMGALNVLAAEEVQAIAAALEGTGDTIFTDGFESGDTTTWSE